MTNAPDGQSPVSTVMTGQIADHAALIGVIKGRYELGYQLPTVECIE